MAPAHAMEFYPRNLVLKTRLLKCYNFVLSVVRGGQAGDILPIMLAGGEKLWPKTCHSYDACVHAPVGRVTGRIAAHRGFHLKQKP